MVPQELRDRKQWLVWRLEAHEEQGKKPRKMPYYIDGGRRVGKQGDERDRARLATFAEAMKNKPPEGKGGIGFAFLPDDGLAGIDLDKMIDPATGEINEQHANIVKALDSYTEISPSRTGVHIFVSTKDVGAFSSFKTNSIGVEVFCGAQFFTVTGELYSGSTTEIRPLSESNLKRLRATVRAKKAGGAGGAGAPGSTLPANDEERRAEAALVYVDADDYQTWIDIGLALKHAFGDGAYALWDRWSTRSQKYPGGEETRRRWGTFNPSGAIKLGTVFELAKRGGWTPPRAPKRSKPAPEGEPSRNDLPPGDEGPPPAGDDGSLPLIRIKAGELERILDEAEAALMASPTKIYQRGGFLVRVVRREARTVRNYTRPPGTLGFHPIEKAFLVEKFTSAARWEKYNARDERWQRINCPDQIAEMFMARSGHWKLPKLWSVITAPTLRPDGTLLQKPGYDEATGTWYDPCGVEFPVVPDKPSREDADRAMAALRDAFRTVPFASKVDEAVLYSLVLTSLVRRSLPAAPLGGISAFEPSSGKTLIADSISIIGTGSPAPAMKLAETDEEAAKTALALLSEGDQVVLIDNVERPLQGDWLCTILTSESYRQRVLGRTEMMNVSTSTLFLATGNHLVTAGDMRTRALLCRIDPKCEHPQKRQFDQDLRELVSARRPQLVAAGLTIMRAYMAAEQRLKDHCEQWGRFEKWTEMVRAPLIWLGCEDPCQSLTLLENEDPERGELVRMLHAWHECFDDQPTTARAVIERTSDHGSGLTAKEKNLRDILVEIGKDRGGEVNAKRVAKWLQRHVGRRVKGRQFVKHGELDHVALWKVEVLAAG